MTNPEQRGAQADAVRRRVLVVDDNEDAATSLAMVLELQEHEVRTAGDGPAALQAAESFRPDIAILDIGLPGMDGYEVAHRLRQAPWGARMVLVALTGWGQEQDKRLALEAGFDHHLTKPLSHSRLQDILAASAP